MPSLLVPSVPYYRNPTFRPGLAALVEFLMGRDYTSHAIGRIFDFVACNGTLEGSLIEAEDMADAEAVFVDAMPPIDFDNPVWGSDDDLDDLDIPPISGGAPEHEYTDQDHADHMAWLDGLDADYPPDDQPEPARRSDLDPTVLAGVHMALYGTLTPFSA
jgi:hypothetical protein